MVASCWVGSQIDYGRFSLCRHAKLRDVASKDRVTLTAVG
jgi:hypothetical protein